MEDVVWVLQRDPSRCACPGGLGRRFQNWGLEVVLTDCFKLWEESEQCKGKFMFIWPKRALSCKKVYRDMSLTVSMKCLCSPVREFRKISWG